MHSTGCFSGFVGPSDVSSLAAVQRVTRVFELPHVLPSGEDSLVLSVTSPRNYLKLQVCSPQAGFNATTKAKHALLPSTRAKNEENIPRPLVLSKIVRS